MRFGWNYIELDSHSPSSQVSTYSFDTHSKTAQIRVLNIKEGTSHLVSEDSAASDPIWISEKEIVYVKSLDNGASSLVAQHVLDPNE